MALAILKCSKIAVFYLPENSRGLFRVGDPTLAWDWAGFLAGCYVSTAVVLARAWLALGWAPGWAQCHVFAAVVFVWAWFGLG